MKHIPLFLGALGAACMLASCGTDEIYYTGGGSYKAFGPPTYGPLYFNRGVYPSYSDRPGYYHQIPSPPSSSHYVFNDQELPAHTPVKAKTWRYTSRYPSAWGAPIWVTSFKPTHLARAGTPVATVTPGE